MPLKWWICTECGVEFRTKQLAPVHCEDVAAVELMTTPNIKFMEKQDTDKNKSALVNQEKVLRERARKHSRDNDMHDLVQKNEDYLAKQNGWIKENGAVRKSIDDK